MVEDELLDRFLGLLDGSAPGLPGGFLPARESFGEKRVLLPMSFPCLRWLDRLEAIACPEGAPLASLLRREADAFRWGQTYGAGDFGADFLRNYGWLEVFGSRGPFLHEDIAGGLLLLGPETLYPDHRHIAEEIYIPLTSGSEWRMGGAPFAPREAGEVIHHASNVTHAMRTGGEPLLALYLWRGGPLDQKSEIGGFAQTPSQRRSG